MISAARFIFLIWQIRHEHMPSKTLSVDQKHTFRRQMSSYVFQRPGEWAAADTPDSQSGFGVSNVAAPQSYTNRQSGDPVWKLWKHGKAQLYFHSEFRGANLELAC